MKGKVLSDNRKFVVAYNYDKEKSEMTYQVYPVLKFKGFGDIAVYIPLYTKIIAGTLEECKASLKNRLNTARVESDGPSGLVTRYIWKGKTILTAGYCPAEDDFSLMADIEPEGFYCYTNVYPSYRDGDDKLYVSMWEKLKYEPEWANAEALSA